MDDSMMNFLDENLNIMVTRIELEGQTCNLKHSKNDPAENHPAVNYLCQGLGFNKTNESLQEIRIPICQECLEAMHDPDWILVFCTYCHASQWIFRPKAKFTYPEGNGIYFLGTCPLCAKNTDEFWKTL